MFLITLTVYIFVTYMFINCRHWHFENKRFHSCSKYLLSAFSMLPTTVGIRNITVNGTDGLVSLEA